MPQEISRSPETKQRLRFRTIDGLRGLAALAVVLFHLNEALVHTYGPWAPGFIASILGHGYLGVDAFFVISGFVITYSVRNADLSFGFIGRFALRRSIRLDPPYWAAMALEIAFIWLGLRMALTVTPLPSARQVFSHFLYAQDLLGYGGIIIIFWTLCFEIQFYLGLILLLAIHRRLQESLGRPAARRVAVLALSALFLYSVMARYHAFGVSAHPGFAVLRWFQFFMGVCVWWVVSGKTSWYALAGMWLVTGAIVIIEQQPLYELLAVTVSAMLWWSYQRDKMASFLSSRPLLFLGGISYSLYLFHSTIGWRFVRASGLLLEADTARPIVWLVFGAAVAICVGTAWIAWALVERPSMRFSRRFSLSSWRARKLRPTSPVPEGAKVAAGLDSTLP